VQVRHDEGVAIHIGPEPCVIARKGRGEASAGECIGQPLSRESYFDPSADAVDSAEGNTDGGVMRASGRLGVVADPGMCRRSLNGNREVPRSTDGHYARQGPHREGEEP
jgi:hypothetical protein